MLKYRTLTGNIPQHTSDFLEQKKNNEIKSKKKYKVKFLLCKCLKLGHFESRILNAWTEFLVLIFHIKYHTTMKSKKKNIKGNVKHFYLLFKLFKLSWYELLSVKSGKVFS